MWGLNECGCTGKNVCARTCERVGAGACVCVRMRGHVSEYARVCARVCANVCALCMSRTVHDGLYVCVDKKECQRV